MSTTAPTDIAVIMMVKDEADIIEQAVMRWHDAGARLYVCDNGSTDGTFEILERLHSECVLHYLESDPETAYKMEERINRLKDIAIDNGATWIFPADPDEVWHFPGDLPGYLSHLNASGGDWFTVHYFDALPNGKKRMNYPHRKCFGKITKEQKICIGNHFVVGSEGKNCQSLIIEHIPVRSFEQMKKKVVNHMEAFTAAGYDHPHTRNFNRYKEDPDAFFAERWEMYNP